MLHNYFKHSIKEKLAGARKRKKTCLKKWLKERKKCELYIWQILEIVNCRGKYGEKRRMKILPYSGIFIKRNKNTRRNKPN